MVYNKNDKTTELEINDQVLSQKKNEKKVRRNTWLKKLNYKNKFGNSISYGLTTDWLPNRQGEDWTVIKIVKRKLKSMTTQW